jgi:hypothetical protein
MLKDMNKKKYNEKKKRFYWQNRNILLSVQSVDGFFWESVEWIRKKNKQRASSSLSKEILITCNKKALLKSLSIFSVVVCITIIQSIRMTNMENQTGQRLYHCVWEGCDYKTCRITSLKEKHTRTCKGNHYPSHRLLYKSHWKGCDDRSSRSESLTTHARMHTGEKLYSCGCKEYR